MSDCELCGDTGRLGRRGGAVVYCACRNGIAAELEDIDRELSTLGDQLASMPICESNRRERHMLQVHFDVLKSEYDTLERELWKERVTE